MLVQKNAEKNRLLNLKFEIKNGTFIKHLLR